MNPLVVRPPYGKSSPALPRGGAVAESGLPSGTPGGRGLSLDPDLAGTRTFAKPVEDIREEDPQDESIHKVDNADDLAKDQSFTPKDERDHSGFRPSLHPPDSRDLDDDTSKTKYPYRDGIPNTHNASTLYVAEAWKAETAPSWLLPAEERLKVAVRLGDVLQGLNSKVVQKAQSCTVTLKRSDPKNLRWLFSVDCGNGPKVVRIKAERSRSVVKLTRMDLEISCSCPAWRWLGSEHHAKREEYLDGKPRGTASKPVIKDPKGVNRVCKHVAATLSLVKTWEVPRAK